MPKDLQTQIVQFCKEYSKATTEDIEKTLNDVAKEAKAKLGSTSPKNKGGYKKGWTIKKIKRASGYEIHIHNKRYQLTHLLENGHKKSNGRGFVAAQPHIEPVDTWAENEIEKRLREVLSG